MFISYAQKKELGDLDETPLTLKLDWVEDNQTYKQDDKKNSVP